jgi:RNA-directed DNA polymerase
MAKHRPSESRSLAEANRLLEAIRRRLAECGLELHPEKTKILYRKDDDRRCDHGHTKFDFLAYTFRPRRAKNHSGKPFISFLSCVSTKATNSIRETIRSWRIGGSRNSQSLEEIAHFVNAFVRGWVNYYANFYPSALTPVLRCLAQACFQESNRRMRTRMSGGVRGVLGNRAPISIMVHRPECVVFRGSGYSYRLLPFSWIP